MTTSTDSWKGFEFECEHLQAAWIVTSKKIASLLGARGLSVTEDSLATFSLEISRELDGELPLELQRALQRVRLHNGPGRAEPADPETLRGMAYAMPALAAAMASGRDPLDPDVLDTVLDVMWRTALWRLGRGFHGELGGPEVRPGRSIEVSDPVRRRVIGMWIERMHRMTRMSSPLGECLVRGLDYFGMSLIGSVAWRTFDDQRFTREEAREVASSALDFRLALVTALLWVIRADERHVDLEERALKDLLDRLGFTPAEIRLVSNECRDGVQGPGRYLLRLVSRPADRMYILARAREMARLDHVESEREREVLTDLAQLLELSPSTRFDGQPAAD